MASGTNTGRLVWNGSNAATYANAYMSGHPAAASVWRLPRPVAGMFAVVRHRRLRSAAAAQNVSGTGRRKGLSGSATDACNALTNASMVSGKIALHRPRHLPLRGEGQERQNAGAVAASSWTTRSKAVAGMADKRRDHQDPLQFGDARGRRGDPRESRRPPPSAGVATQPPVATSGRHESHVYAPHLMSPRLVAVPLGHEALVQAPDGAEHHARPANSVAVRPPGVSGHLAGSSVGGLRQPRFFPRALASQARQRLLDRS